MALGSVLLGCGTAIAGCGSGDTDGGCLGAARLEREGREVVEGVAADEEIIEADQPGVSPIGEVSARAGGRAEREESDESDVRGVDGAGSLECVGNDPRDDSDERPREATGAREPLPESVANVAKPEPAGFAGSRALEGGPATEERLPRDERLESPKFWGVVVAGNPP